MPANLLGLRENPFAAGHDPRLIFHSDPRAEIVTSFRQALASGEPFVLVTGESGVGKTSVVTQVLADEKAWSALITNPLLTRAELLEEICLRFGVDLPETVSKPRLLAELERHLAEIRREDETPVLVVDEAHDLSLELLEELRLLSNLEFKGRALVQIVLVGLPALEARLAQGDLAQLRQRIATHARLKPLDAESTWRYIHHRVSVAGGEGTERFPDETCLEIHRLTRGVPRAINMLAGHALLAASRESERVVTVQHVQATAADTWLRNVSDGAPPAGSGVSGASKPAAERSRSKPATAAADQATSSEPVPPPTKESKPAGKSGVKKASTPTVPAPKPVSTPTSDPPTSREPSCGDPEAEPALPPRTSGEPEVREWISRFVDPENPIQIGIHAGSRSGSYLQPGDDPEVAPGANEMAAESIDRPATPRPKGRSAPPPSRGRRNRDSVWITAASGLVLVIAAVVVIAPRLRPKASAPADSAAVSATIPPSPSARPERPSVARKASVVPALTTARVARGAPTDTTSVPRRWQGLEVATYLDPYRASAESARLSEVTGLSSRVMEASDRDGEAYRVVLGSFGTRKRAERAADDLIGRGLIEQARVVSLGPMPSQPE